MDWSALQQLGMTPGFGGAAPGGGVLGQILKQMSPAVAPPAPPAVPADGSMMPTIGPSATPPVPKPPAYTPGIGLPKGGLLGIANGTAQPQGLAGLLKFMSPTPPPAAAGPLAAPPSSGAGMIGPPPPTAPTQILPDVQMQNQF
jgi:hypothetical protein